MVNQFESRATEERRLTNNIGDVGTRRQPRLVFSADVTTANCRRSAAMLPNRTTSLPVAAGRTTSDPSTGFSCQPERSALPLIPNNGHLKRTDTSSTSSGQRGQRRGGQRRSTGGAVPPDGGWGWIVAFASFTINFIVDGVCLSYGVFYVELRENFGHDSISKIAFIGSLTTGMCLFMGQY